MEEEIKEKKGVGLKAFGMSLILLSSLNLMLSWRGGFPIDLFYPTILVVGIALFVVGTLKGK
ncbi:MAG: hypothetical protein AABY54_00570 [Deltaproteobacteria bacterium]